MGNKILQKKYKFNNVYPLDVVSHIPHMLIYGWMIEMYM